MKIRPSHRHKRRNQALFPSSRVTANPRIQQALTASLTFVSVSFAIGQPSSDPSSSVGERGYDFAVYRRVSTVADPTGRTTATTNQFTLLENCLNYFEDGQWKESEDLIETAPDGAIARRGPNKAIFSPDLSSPAVFDILTSDGKRLRGGVRAIQVTDIASGKSVTLATVKASAPGELLPPNQIVYRQAFDGLDADVLLVWKHNYFGQDVVFRAQPQLPEGMSPNTTRLEIVSEIVEAPQPIIRKQTVLAGNAGQLEDDVVINFGRLAFVMGKAFPVTNDLAWAVGGLNSSEGSLPVLKQWRALPDGRIFLIESIGWTDAQPHLKGLPAATQARATPTSNDQTDVARVWPERPKPLADAKPLVLARLGYQPQGWVLDFVIIPDSGTPATLTANTTYYIKTSYYSGSLVTIEPGCFIKYKNNAYMLVYGPVSFPYAPQAMPIFTSRNDNNFGQVIQGVQGETDSNGDPTVHKAAPAIWSYYPTSPQFISDLRIRWAKIGIQFDRNVDDMMDHTVRDALFEHIVGTGSIGITGDLTYVSTANLTKCDVSNPGVLMSEDCGVVSIARVNDPAQDSASGDPNKNSQSECSFVVVDSSTIVAGFFDTHLSEYALGSTPFARITAPRSTGWGVSVNGGASFTDNGAIPPTAPADTTQGDAGDPVMARDTGNGTIYLLTNPSRESATWAGFRLWKSTDNGQSVSLVNTSVPAGVTGADKPMIAVNNFPGTANYHHLYVAGVEVLASLRSFVSRSTNDGATWDTPQYLSSQGSQANGAELAIAPDGTVYVFYIVNGSTVSLWYSWRRTVDSAWQTPVQISAHTDSQGLYSLNPNASGNPRRSNSAAEADYFVNNAFPRAAVNPISGRAYLVYADLPFSGSSTDRCDIFINEGVPQADGSLNWTGVRKLNNDGTATDQWNPSIAINPAGTLLFVGYYSRQDDPNNNALIKAYGAKANLANGFATATFDVFPISATAFPALFPGTTTSTPPQNTWMYDHVWIQTDVCLDDYAMVVEPCDPVSWLLAGGKVSNTTYQHLMGDDYTWTSADGSYFYFAWCDRSDTYYSGGNSRPDPNIRLGKVKQ